MIFGVDFLLVLSILVLVSGVMSLIDIVFFQRKREQRGARQPRIFEYSRAFFPVFLTVLAIRSFVFQPYRVVSGSLEPTVAVGDFLAVKQFAYGLRLPVSHTKVLNVSEPKVGQIALFRYPINPAIVFVKRVVGTPGDHVEYHNKVLTVNGIEAKTKVIGQGMDEEPGRPAMPMILKEENLAGIKHKIYVSAEGGEEMDIDLVVPKGSYFMMGDNRDDSSDSRVWGVVPEENLIGEAGLVILSWDSNKDWLHKLRFARIGKGFTI